MTQQIATGTTTQQRLNCSVCNYRIDPNNESAFAEFPCAIRAFQHETFKVWRCPDCGTLHCLDVVNLDDYFAPYPNSQLELTWILKIVYRKLLSEFTKHGFSREHSLLDYGCGPNAPFVQYLQHRGFTHTYGYDRYGSPDGFGNLAVLDRGPFDYISLQYVIGHFEDPNPLFSQLNSLLNPGGYVFIGTPNAANINLNRPDLPDNYIPAHIPHQPHIYTRETLEAMGRRHGWEPIDFFDRKFDDTPWFGLNHRAYNAYASLFDGSIDVLVAEPTKLWKAFTSPKFLFYAAFGYWLSTHAEMNIVFRKRR
jgi:SAM-dependent methyltransferase